MCCLGAYGFATVGLGLGKEGYYGAMRLSKRKVFVMSINLLSRRVALVAAALVLALGAAVALAGCTGGSGNPGKPEAVGNRAAEASADASASDANPAAGDVVSTAMVVYNDGGTVLFVDQDTGSLYYPTLIGEGDDVVFGLNGDDIDADELAVGNIVQVTGNGIMLESYPGQYPGITKVEVIEQGTPADADQYAELIEQVVVAPDPAEVPSAYVEYTTDLAQTSVMLQAYDYDWVVPGDGNANADKRELDGDFDDAQGVLVEGVADARIAAPVDALIGFSVAPTNVVVERTPLVSTDKPAVDPNAEDEPIAATLQSDGTVTFTMEPGYAYEVDADFAQGEASYAFYTLS